MSEKTGNGETMEKQRPYRKTRRGYVVLDIDYRGSAGYGRDWRTDVHDFLGGKDYEDHLDAIDYAVGFACHKKLGDAVQRGEEIGVIFCRRESHADSISEKLRNAYKIATEKTRKSELVKEIIS